MFRCHFLGILAGPRRSGKPLPQWQRFFDSFSDMCELVIAFLMASETEDSSRRRQTENLLLGVLWLDRFSLSRP
jgi:hypothetical protein